MRKSTIIIIVLSFLVLSILAVTFLLPTSEESVINIAPGNPYGSMTYSCNYNNNLCTFTTSFSKNTPISSARFFPGGKGFKVDISKTECNTIGGIYEDGTCKIYELLESQKVNIKYTKQSLAPFNPEISSTQGVLRAVMKFEEGFVLVGNAEYPTKSWVCNFEIPIYEEPEPPIITINYLLYIAIGVVVTFIIIGFLVYLKYKK